MMKFVIDSMLIYRKNTKEEDDHGKDLSHLGKIIGEDKSELILEIRKAF